MKAILVNMGPGVARKGLRGYFAVGRTGEDLTLHDEDVQKGTVYIKDCKNCSYVVMGTCMKLLIQGCENVSVKLHKGIITSTIEVWRCNNVSVDAMNRIETLQLDLSSNVHLHFPSTDTLGSVVWAGVRKLTIDFDDTAATICTGYDELKMMSMYSDINDTTDQFIIRLIHGKLYHERIVRIGGYVTTAREKKEHDERYARDRERGMKALQEMMLNQVGL